MDGGVKVSSWVTIRQGCPISYEILGSGVAHVLCGKSSNAFEFEIHSEALRELVGLGNAALREMDALYAHEEAADRS